MRIFVNLSLILLLAVLASCGPGLEKPDLPLPEGGIPKNQENFDVKFESLTLDVAKKANAAPYPRDILHAGTESRANRISEQDALIANPPPNITPTPYRIGVGDQLQMILLIDSDQLQSATTRNSLASGYSGIQEVAESRRTSLVSEKGDVLFIETGPIKVLGLTLDESRAEVAKALVRNGYDKRFQLELSQLNSQRVYVSGAGRSATFPITQRGITLRQLIIAAGIARVDTKVQIVSIDRDGKRYQLPIERIFAKDSPDYYLQDNDMVLVDQYNYSPSKAYVLGGDSVPTILTIQAEARQTLADILFVKNGPLATKTARESEIYVLRGTDPMIAYHLDALNVTRLRIASDFELRPNDIVFTAPKPIYSGIELLSVIAPFRTFADSVY